MGRVEPRECKQPMKGLGQCAQVAVQTEPARARQLRQLPAVSTAVSKFAGDAPHLGLKAPELSDSLARNLEYLFSLFPDEHLGESARHTHLEHPSVPISVGNSLEEYNAWLASPRRHTEFVAYELLLTGLCERFSQQPLQTDEPHPAEPHERSHDADQQFESLMRRIERPIQQYFEKRLADPADREFATLETWAAVHNRFFHETNGRRFAGCCEFLTAVIGIGYCRLQDGLRQKYRQKALLEGLFKRTDADQLVEPSPNHGDETDVRARPVRARLVNAATQRLIQHIKANDELPAGLAGLVFDKAEQAEMLDASCRHENMRLVTSDYFFRVNTKAKRPYRRSELARKYGVTKAAITQYLDGYVQKGKSMLGSQEVLLQHIKEKVGLT